MNQMDKNGVGNEMLMRPLETIIDIETKTKYTEVTEMTGVSNHEKSYMKAKVLRLEYDPGYFCLTNGHKEYERSGYRNGRYVSQRGYGWASECKGSRLTLKVDLGGLVEEIWVDRYFKERLGRLTEKRRRIIEATVPDEVCVDMKETRNGGIYYVVSEEDMDLWFQRAVRYL